MVYLKQQKASQACSRSCLNVQVKILRGRNITQGWQDWIDTPDPFVTLSIPTAPDGRRKTRVISNNKNPEWNETFSFFIDPEVENILTLRLWDDDFNADDPIGSPAELPLEDLVIGKTVSKTVAFGKSKAQIDVEYKTLGTCEGTDLRHSLELCGEEIAFLVKRKTVVFNAMTSLLGEGGPRTMDEVPMVAVLGSGGGYRAMTCFSAVVKALAEAKVLDCSTYISGLSGSAWYVSMLYSRGSTAGVDPYDTQAEIRAKISSSPWRFLRPGLIRNYRRAMDAKKREGQPISFTDFFGHFVGSHLLREKKELHKLSEQRVVVNGGLAPLPINTSLHVKSDVSAQLFSEWVEYTPFEIGMAKYGTFMKSELFNSVFFCGKLVKQYPESPLHYLQGIWGSAFTILLQRLTSEESSPEQVKIEMKERKGDGRNELRDDTTSKLGEEDNEDDLEVTKEELKLKKQANALEKAGKKSAGLNDAPEQKEEEGEEKDEEEKEEDPSFRSKVLKSVMEMFPRLQSRKGRAGVVHNFLRGLEFQGEGETVEDGKQTVTARKIMMVDAGLEFNSPYPAVLRPQRDVDVLLSFDFSAREHDDDFPFKELKLAEQWARRNDVPFPPINAEEQFEKEGWKECYVFKDPTDPACPIVLHFVLVNKTYRDYIKPGVKRTAEEKKAANFSLFDDPDGTYSTFNFKMSPKNFDRLCSLVEFNTQLSVPTIKDSLAEKVKQKRQATGAVCSLYKCCPFPFLKRR